MPLARCLLGQLWVASQDEPLLQLLSWARRMELRGPWLLVLDGLEAPSAAREQTFHRPKCLGPTYIPYYI